MAYFFGRYFGDLLTEMLIKKTWVLIYVNERLTQYAHTISAIAFVVLTSYSSTNRLKLLKKSFEEIFFTLSDVNK